MSASTNTISTYKAFLMKGTTANNSTTYAKLVDIKSFPDLGGAPEMLETTTLSDGMQTFIPGIQKLDALEFTANYKESDYETLKTLEASDTETDFALWFGASVSGGVATPTGDRGKFTFKGKLSVHVNGGGVNEVVEMTITIAPSTVVTKVAAS